MNIIMTFNFVNSSPIYYVPSDGASETLSSNLTQGAEHAASLWDQVQPTAQKVYNAVKKPLILGGLWGATIATTALEPTGPASAVSASIAAITTKNAVKKWWGASKVALVASAALGGYALNSMLTEVPGLNQVPFVSYAAVLGLSLFKGVTKSFMKPKKEEVSSSVTFEDITDGTPRPLQQEAVQNSVQEVYQDVKWALTHVDPETKKAPLWKRLTLLGVANAAMIGVTKFNPKGMLALAMTQFAAAPTKAFLRSWPMAPKYGAIALLTTAAYSAKEFHPTLYAETLSLGNSTAKIDIKEWMNPRDAADSDDEEEDLEANRAAVAQRQATPTTLYGRCKQLVKSSYQAATDGYTCATSYAAEKLQPVTNALSCVVPGKLKEWWTKSPDKKTPPIAKRVVAAAGTTVAAGVASAAFPGQVVEATSATLAAATSSSFWWSVGTPTRVAGVALGLGAGYAVQWYLLPHVPYLSNMQLGSLMGVTAYNVAKKWIKKQMN